MSFIYLGIDPGKSGGIAFIDERSGTSYAYPYSNERLNQLASDEPYRIKCIVEKVGAMPGQGVTSMFNFGMNFGYIQGVLEANGISYQLVPPRTWKKEFSLDFDKQKSIECCKRLFPHVNLKRTDKCRNDHDGMAESLLIAEYARRKLK